MGERPAVAASGRRKRPGTWLGRQVGWGGVAPAGGAGRGGAASCPRGRGRRRGTGGWRPAPPRRVRGSHCSGFEGEEWKRSKRKVGKAGRKMGGGRRRRDRRRLDVAGSYWGNGGPGLGRTGSASARVAVKRMVLGGHPMGAGARGLKAGCLDK